MNREERRGMKDRLLMRTKKAKSYVTLTFDGRGLPICSYDLTVCTDKNDIRHLVMHECSLFVEKKVRLMRQGIEERVAEMEQAERVKKAKEQRSAELAAVNYEKQETKAA